MYMSNCLPYVNRFFDELEMFEDVSCGHSYKAYISGSVREFLTKESRENALEVYRMFFDSYRISMPGEENSFADIVDILLRYEDTAATLIEKQRDHVVHSVNVFITGLCIYSASPAFREAFASAVPEKEYHSAYSTKNEEFFYRWGIASLFHDVGYPLEIVGRQLNEFIGMIADADGKDIKVKARISFDNEDELRSVSEVIPREEFSSGFRSAYDGAGRLDLLKAHDLLAFSIHHRHGADLNSLLEKLDGFVASMGETGMIDHGYYSALIVLKWYGFLIQSCGYKSEYFYWPVLDSAAAILLHNWYKLFLQKEPFMLGAMKAGDDPTAFLLILCDELQEWNREARGRVSRGEIRPDSVVFEINENSFSTVYITKKGRLPDGFSEKKKETILRLLDMGQIFPGGIDIRDEVLDMWPEGFRGPAGHGTRPRLSELERLAEAVHRQYNEGQTASGKTTEFPEFSDLPDDLKYSNLRQARRIYDKLESVGLHLRKTGMDGALENIPEELVEILAEMEHDEWLASRRASGWTLGEKDTEAKRSPYLVPYEQLSEEIRELDRQSVRNIPKLAGMIGMGVYEY